MLFIQGKDKRQGPHQEAQKSRYSQLRLPSPALQTSGPFRPSSWRGLKRASAIEPVENPEKSGVNRRWRLLRRVRVTVQTDKVSATPEEAQDTALGLAVYDRWWKVKHPIG
jgi:hypothetical protein